MLILCGAMASGAACDGCVLVYGIKCCGRPDGLRLTAGSIDLDDKLWSANTGNLGLHDGELGTM